MFSRYNKRINDIRECKEQALSHAYVQSFFYQSLSCINFYSSQKYFTCYGWTARISVLFSFSASHFWTSFQLCLQPLVCVLRSLSQKHNLRLIFIPHSFFALLHPPRFVSLRCLISAFILITYSVFPFHLHSHSSAVAVICLLLSSCRIVLKVSKYHLIVMLVWFDALLWLPVCLSLSAVARCTEKDANFSVQLWRSWLLCWLISLDFLVPRWDIKRVNPLCHNNNYIGYIHITPLI